MPLAIVIDESRATCISHAAYNQIAYRLDDDSPTFTKIGEVAKDGLVWKLTYTSEITASKEPLSPEDILKITMSKKAKDAKKTHSQKIESSEEKSLSLPSPMTQETDIGSVAAELFLCQPAMPVKQYLSWRDSLNGENTETVRDNIRRLKISLASTGHAPFWREMSHDERLMAFQNAIRSGVPVTLHYVTPDGTFCLTAADLISGEAIGLLITFAGQAAYGPYPFSRLREIASSFWISDKETSLEQICNDHGIDLTAQLPTPEQLLKWDEKK
jgi:hypothetical protein